MSIWPKAINSKRDRGTVSHSKTDVAYMENTNVYDTKCKDVNITRKIYYKMQLICYLTIEPLTW